MITLAAIEMNDIAHAVLNGNLRHRAHADPAFMDLILAAVETCGQRMWGADEYIHELERKVDILEDQLADAEDDRDDDRADEIERLESRVAALQSERDRLQYILEHQGFSDMTRNLRIRQVTRNGVSVVEYEGGPTIGALDDTLHRTLTTIGPGGIKVEHWLHEHTGVTYRRLIGWPRPGEELWHVDAPAACAGGGQPDGAEPGSETETAC